MGGGFGGIEDIQQRSINTSCIGIGIEGIPTNRRTNTNQLDSTLNFSLFLITSNYNKPVKDKEIEAYKLLEKLNLIIMAGPTLQGRSLDSLLKEKILKVYPTEQESITCKNFYGPDLYKKDMCLWEINWRQKVLLGKDRFEDGGFGNPEIEI
ncbi:hypothetical protein ABSA28_01157 [Candidatus Hepatincolaceae symbiont of Richtersius coronifer]